MMLDWPALQAPLQQHRNVALREILLDFQGPQIAIWSVDGASYLGVAADEQDDVVRWIAAPVTVHELNAVKLGTMALRDVLSQTHAMVLDQNGEGEITFYGDISMVDVPEEALPEHGAPLPDEVTRHFRAELEGSAGCELPILLVVEGCEAAHERTLRVLGEVFVPLQKLVDAIGQRIIAAATHKGVVARDIRSRTTLSMAAFSFGSAILEFTPADPDLYEEISERLQRLSLSSADDTALAAELLDLGPRVRASFGELIAVAARHQVSLHTQSRQSGATFSRHTADSIRNSLSAAPDGEAEQIELLGQFVAFDTRNGSFEFVDDDDLQQYRGTVSPRVLPKIASVVVGTGTQYRVWLQLQAMRRVGADQTTDYVLSRMELVNGNIR
jgi:hypothetical protein